MSQAMNDWLTDIPETARVTQTVMRDARNLVFAQCVRGVDLLQDGSQLTATATVRSKQRERNFYAVKVVCKRVDGQFACLEYRCPCA